jgi:hypothetical protein
MKDLIDIGGRQSNVAHQLGSQKMSKQSKERDNPVPDPGGRHAALWNGNAHHAFLHPEQRSRSSSYMLARSKKARLE